MDVHMKPSKPARTGRKPKPENTALGGRSEITAKVAAITPASCQGRRHGNSTYRPGAVRAVLSNIVRGLSLRVACNLAGVAESTFYEWRSENPDFDFSVQQAEALGQDRLLEAVRAGFPRKPELALELLRTRWPKDWPKVTKEAAVVGVSFDDLVRMARENRSRDSASAAATPAPDQVAAESTPQATASPMPSADPAPTSPGDGTLEEILGRLETRS